MTAPRASRRANLTPDEQAAVREVLGYLNFSGGKPDPAFAKNLNRLHERLDNRPWHKLQPLLQQSLTELERASTAFADSTQAAAVLRLTFDELIPAYRRHHADLFFHLDEADLQYPFLLARFFEAVLEQGPPWDQTARIVEAGLTHLNDFQGYRPVAVLENGRRMEPYPHERFRPVPLYLRDAGVSCGPYCDLIERTLAMLAETPPETLRESYFDPERLDELALDLRAHDHAHPVNKRTNYLFGEWDPQQIDLQGYFRRFVLRKIILDALLRWMTEQKRVSREEVLFDAAAVLSGTILMASSISGSGPAAHDSSVTLTSLLPKVARQRDAFYAHMLDSVSGKRAKRLQRQARQTQQPFGHVRQHLNMFLAQYGADQVQHRQLAYLYARMGDVAASLREAAVIPSLSVRFECEIHWRLTVIHRLLDSARLDDADQRLAEIEDHLHRGIECGAFVDPWNILGYQGNFPLFAAREDAVPDQRVEILLQLVEQFFDACARAWAEAAAQGDREPAAAIARRFQRVSAFWDQFGTTAVADLPSVSGQESYESALHVSEALAEWRAAGEAAGDITFWRRHVDRFSSCRAYAQVVKTLLAKHDSVASMGLLIEWLSRADEVGLESGPYSLCDLLIQWTRLVGEQAAAGMRPFWPNVRRLFDYLEANAGQFWNVPRLDDAAAEINLALPDVAAADDDEADDEDEPDEDAIYGAAYDGVVFRDSALDGQVGDTYDGGYGSLDVEFERMDQYFEPRLKFVKTLADLWQLAAVGIAAPAAEDQFAGDDDRGAQESEQAEFVTAWLQRTQQLQSDLRLLMDSLAQYEVEEPVGDHDSNIEFDMQLQTKFYLLHGIIATSCSCRCAEWSLAACLPDAGGDELRRSFVSVFRGLVRGDAHEVRRVLPGMIRLLRRKPLLYVPLDQGGDARQVLAARTLQALIRFLLSHLPRLGLLRETWHLLETAQRMERASRPQGLAVTEFDRLFRIALRESLECAVTASARWRSGRFSDEELIDVVGSIVEQYLELWLEHSQTMRLSSIEALKFDSVFDEVREFISDYGSDLFQPRHLTLGNIRTILHNGVEVYLQFLAEHEDPLRPMRLLDDLDHNRVELDDVVNHLELIYQALVDRFDRFIEYNTTTTQSDYGEMLYTLLDFLRLEVAYDRDAWNLLPVGVAHEVLVRAAKDEAAHIWEDVFAGKTQEMADDYLAHLKRLENQYGMRLPSIANHLGERFVKPLAVNEMLSLIRPAIDELRGEPVRGKMLTRLQDTIDKYQRGGVGSGLDVPAWLRTLEDEINRVDAGDAEIGREIEPELPLPPPKLNLREMRSQLKNWKQPLTPRKRKK